MKNGQLIVAMGLPGSGKSSVIKKVGELTDTRCFLEIEESEYTEVVRRRDIYGSFTAMTWFRAMRMPNLYEAYELAQNGNIVFLDTYYDKLLSKYIGKDGMEWLISTDDEYYDIIRNITELDYSTLPDANCIISFELTYETWLRFLRRRNRQLLDNDQLFLNSFKTQEYFIEAAHQYCEEQESKGNSCKFIRFQQEFSSLEDSAMRLLQLLREHKIVN